MTTPRTILVTGANRGLGMNTVHQLSMTPDVLVFMGSRKLTAAEEALATFASDIHATSVVVPVQLDITDANSISAAHTFISSYLSTRNIPGLDVLINNAAILVPSFRETYEVNVFGTVAITEAIRPLINNNGAIVNISSTMGSVSSVVNVPGLLVAHAYGSSKSALNNMTANWAVEEQKKGSGIRVVSICPGYNYTRLNGWTGTMSPAEGCQVIVKTALEKEGRTAVFFNKDKDLEW
ncbi:short-chain dehydrogenase/reductase SDR [Mycena galericulata]|nr:short-chain dehydrogenase/reductase SDR [Mycena galericulata]